jgi:hypothetical protein
MSLVALASRNSTKLSSDRSPSYEIHSDEPAALNLIVGKPATRKPADEGMSFSVASNLATVIFDLAFE